MVDHPPVHKLYVPSAPTTYTLELTSRCNNDCVGCGNVFSHNLGEMPAERWQSLLDTLHPHLVNIRVTGGEPTLHCQFAQVMQVIDRLNVPFVLFTNGVWTERPTILQILLGCSNLDGVLISLHGRDSSSHRQFVGRDSFAETIQSIQEAAQAGLSVNTNTVLTRANWGDIAEIADLAFSLGAGSAAFSRYYGEPTFITTLSNEELTEAIESVHALQAQGMPVRFNNNVPACFSGHPSKSCPAGITHCTIDPFGNARPCNHVSLTLGNLFEHSIEELWHSDKARGWRALIPRACYRCAEFNRCRGGCKAMALRSGKGQDPLMRGPLTSEVTSEAPRKLQLYAEALPAGNYSIRQEDFGYMIVNRSRVLVVDHAAKPLLDSLDGAHSLRTIEQQFGQEGLNLVGRLYVEGLVHFNE